MENRIEAILTTANRDEVLDLFRRINEILAFLISLSPEDRQSLVRMGDKSRPLVEQSLVLVEQDDSFMPRSFDAAQMRKDKELYEALQPIIVQCMMLLERLSDTSLLVGSDLMMAALDVYRNAKANGRGEALDNLIPLLGRRFARKSKPKENDGNSNPTS